MAMMEQDGLGTTSFVAQVRNHGATLVLSLKGELDQFSAMSLDALAETLRHQPCDVLVIDLHGLAFLDSAGLLALAELARPMQDQGTRVVTRGASPQQGFMFGLTTVGRRDQFADAAPVASAPAHTPVAPGAPGPEDPRSRFFGQLAPTDGG